MGNEVMPVAKKHAIDHMQDVMEHPASSPPHITPAFLEKVRSCLIEKHEETEALKRNARDIESQIKKLNASLQTEKKRHLQLVDILYQQSQIFSQESELRTSRNTRATGDAQMMRLLTLSMAIQDTLHHVLKAQKTLAYQLSLTQHNILLPTDSRTTKPSHTPLYIAAATTTALAIFSWATYSLMTNSPPDAPPATEKTVGTAFNNLAFIQPLSTNATGTSEPANPAMMQELMAALSNTPSPATHTTDSPVNQEADYLYQQGMQFLNKQPVTEPDIDSAIYSLSQAAQAQHRDAAYQLALIYHQGQWVDQDLKKSYHYYEQAARAAQPYAAYNLALLHLQPLPDIPYNPAEAETLLQHAAEHGVAEAHYALGMLYERGVLGDVRINDALKHYEQAKEAGYQPALQHYNALLKLSEI